jgi:5-carboxymethyl-2-hydroxymuconate isomerase
MPHLTIEYSTELENKINKDAILIAVHQALNNCPELDMSRLKSRVIRHSRVITGSVGEMLEMIHVSLAVLSGRSVETRKSFGECLFSALQKTVPLDMQKTISLTVEVREMEKASYFRN